ncbi:MAG: MoaD/ThiS family protein [Myxococcota bacterium]
MPVVFVPTAYRGPTKGNAEILVAGETVLACLHGVEEKYPGFLPQVLDDGGAVHRFVKLFINREPLDPQALDSELADSDRLEIIAAIAGG